MTSNANVYYANQLVHIVLTHWDALYRKQLPHLNDISHDNAFLSYHPFEFEQRTLLARFRMNLTDPPHIQFVPKPVYGAFSMLGHLAELAGPLTTGCKGNVFVASRGLETDGFYGAILLSSPDIPYESVNHSPIITTNVRIIIPHQHLPSSLIWMAEYLEQNITDPFDEWTRAGRPDYPDANTRQKMRHKAVRIYMQ